MRKGNSDLVLRDGKKCKKDIDGVARTNLCCHSRIDWAHPGQFPNAVAPRRDS